MRIWLALMFLPPLAAQAQTVEPQSCEYQDEYALLDFWVGEWDVYAGEELVGTNRIEKTLKGCAVLEHWTGAQGGSGMSLFYLTADAIWKQVWVTEWATMPGGIKEKTRQPLDDANSVRFQGRIIADKGQTYLDRTTLTRLDGGDVRQLIEVSLDEGATWKSIFDAVYKRRIGT